MLRKEEIMAGVSLRTLSDCFAVPTGTVAKVDTVGVSWEGNFVFTVRWQHLNPGTQTRPISDRSLNLGEEDLAHFEAVSNQEARAARVGPLLHRKHDFKVSPGGYRRTRKGKLLNSNQLDLFTSEDFTLSFS
jgi:hypothetical protein